MQAGRQASGCADRKCIRSSATPRRIMQALTWACPDHPADPMNGISAGHGSNKDSFRRTPGRTGGRLRSCARRHRRRDSSVMSWPASCGRGGKGTSNRHENNRVSSSYVQRESGVNGHLDEAVNRGPTEYQVQTIRTMTPGSYQEAYCA